MNYLVGRKVEFVVPGKARGKQRPRATKTGRVYTPAETRNAEAFIKLLATHAMEDIPIFEGPCRVYIEVDVPVPQSYSKRQREDALGYKLQPIKSGFDCDNIAKAHLDAMNGVVFVDDRQVTQLVIQKRYSEIAQTRVVVEGS